MILGKSVQDLMLLHKVYDSSLVISVWWLTVIGGKDLLVKNCTVILC